MERETRTKQEMYAYIAEIRDAWRELEEKTPVSLDTMKDNLMGQLIALYWTLGHSRESAIDSASIALGGDPIDWS